MKRFESLSAAVIIPCYKEKENLKEILKKTLNQTYKIKKIYLVADHPSPEYLKFLKRIKPEKVNLLINNQRKGLGAAINYGIKHSKEDIIVTLLADCLPTSKDWLKSLMSQFNDKSVVAVSSKVDNLSKEIWKNMDNISKELLYPEKGVYSPLLDEKGCGYKRTAIEKIGGFDDLHFKTAGEDFDMYMRISKHGKIVSGISPAVTHLHSLNLSDYYKRTASYGRGFGVLFRIYGGNLPDYKGGVLRAFFPLWGLAKVLKVRVRYVNRIKLIPIYLKINWIYAVNFIKSFILKRQ